MAGLGKGVAERKCLGQKIGVPLNRLLSWSLQMASTSCSFYHGWASWDGWHRGVDDGLFGLKRCKVEPFLQPGSFLIPSSGQEKNLAPFCKMTPIWGSFFTLNLFPRIVWSCPSAIFVRVHIDSTSVPTEQV